MRLPDIANELRELSKQHGLPRLEELADHMKRRRHGKRPKQTSIKATPEVMDAIRAYRVAHPNKTQAEIAAVFNVNSGRVSEALRGVRK